MVFGIFCCGSIILSMTYPLEIADGHIYDLRTIPWLLAFFYGGLNMGLVATGVIVIYRIFIGIDNGLMISLFTYLTSGIIVLFFLKKYKLINMKQKLKTTFLLTLLSTLFVIIGILYFLENFNFTILPPFFVYYVLSHLVTILIVVYIIETLQEKEQNKIQLKQAERIKLVGEMAAAVAHEVRNPLTVVKGFIQLLKSEENLTTKQKSSFELMDSELQRAEKIIHDYLSLARLESSNIEKIDMKELLLNVVDVIESYALLNGVSIKIDVNESYYVNANRNELSQVFLNIIKNGIEATENKGTIEIKARKTGLFLELSIRDNGKGMSEDEIKRLGSPFYSTKDYGTGLGTMVCYKIINNLKGEIKVKSKINEGTTFFITLPLIKIKSIL